MRTILSLLLAFIILAAFGGLAFYYINISGGAKFERKVKPKAPPTEEPAKP